MAWDTSRQIPDKARKTVRALAGYGLELPGVTAAMQELERVESLAPPLVEPQTLVEHYADPAATRASLDTLAAAIKAHSLTVDAYQQARANAGRVVQTELFNAIDEIIEALRPEAEACITELNWYVSQGRPDVAELVRAGRTKDAQRAAATPSHLTKYLALIDLRDQASAGSRFNWDAATWRTGSPTQNTRLRRATLPVEERWFLAMEDGAEMWWPTLDEALEAIERTQQRATEEAKAHAQRISRQKQSAL